jgi:hypothetical protein
MDVLWYRPDPAELCWTFGGVHQRVREQGAAYLVERG